MTTGALSAGMKSFHGIVLTALFCIMLDIILPYAVIFCSTSAFLPYFMPIFTGIPTVCQLLRMLI